MRKDIMEMMAGWGSYLGCQFKGGWIWEWEL